MNYNNTEEFLTDILNAQYPEEKVFTTKEKKEIHKNLKKIYDLYFSNKHDFSIGTILELENLSSIFHIILLNYSRGFNKKLMGNNFACLVKFLHYTDNLECCYSYIQELNQIMFNGNFEISDYLD